MGGRGLHLRPDEAGYFWLVGRTDDLINATSHLVGPFEVESAVIEHPAVSEAGVIGKPDSISIEIVKAFVRLMEGYEPNEEPQSEILQFIRAKLGAALAPREINFVDFLPRARKLGLQEGDTGTLEVN